MNHLAYACFISTSQTTRTDLDEYCLSAPKDRFHSKCG